MVYGKGGMEYGKVKYELKMGDDESEMKKW